MTCCSWFVRTVCRPAALLSQCNSVIPQCETMRLAVPLLRLFVILVGFSILLAFAVFAIFLGLSIFAILLSCLPREGGRACYGEGYVHKTAAQNGHQNAGIAFRKVRTVAKARPRALAPALRTSPKALRTAVPAVVAPPGTSADKKTTLRLRDSAHVTTQSSRCPKSKSAEARPAQPSPCLGDPPSRNGRNARSFAYALRAPLPTPLCPPRGTARASLLMHFAPTSLRGTCVNTCKLWLSEGYCNSANQVVAF